MCEQGEAFCNSIRTRSHSSTYVADTKFVNEHCSIYSLSADDVETVLNGIAKCHTLNSDYLKILKHKNITTPCIIMCRVLFVIYMNIMYNKLMFRQNLAHIGLFIIRAGTLAKQIKD